MRKLVLALYLALVALLAGINPAAAGDAFDFSDMPPLPPPLLDDSPVAAPPALAPVDNAPLSPLLMPPAPGGQSAPASSVSMPPLAPPSLSPPPMSSSVTPPAPPPITPLAPPAPPPIAATPSVELPGDVPVPPPASVPAATPSIPETPRPAKVSGGRVNVRAGPNTQYESIAVLTTGHPVTVLAKNGDWFKIVYPADQLASIHKNYVDADIVGEIPEEGVTGIVNQDNADVHAFYWDKSTVVGKLNKGDQVVIRQERGQWYRIAAPASARAYVFAEYVRVDGGATVAADSAPPPENPAVDLAQGKQDPTGRLKLSENDRRAAELKESYFQRLREQQVREEEQARQSVNLLEQALDDLDARLKAIDDEIGSQITYPVATTNLGSAAWAPPDPLYGGFTGWVENIGRVGGAPASFRLSKGGEIRFYLRSDRFSLNDFVGRRVWLNGNVELAPGAVANVLNVDQIRILTDQEIAQGMQQYVDSAQSQVVGGYPAQPYAAPQATDPYSVYYGQGDVGSPIPAGPGMVVQPTPVIPSDPSQLPDVVGAGLGGSSAIVGSGGEVDSDFYENPVISEIGP